MAEEPLGDYRTYPRMVHWFRPWLLMRLLNNVFLSSIFGQYADRRLMIAALDTVSPDEHFRRATWLKDQLTPDSEGAVWVDWVADLGDGFDSTYAVASLIGAKTLEVGNQSFQRAQALFMGGDEVYPASTAEAYRNQLRQPYAWAFPDHNRKDDNGVPLYAIPGNHDWYDGLVLFLALFCRENPWHIGSWRTCQRRSYFAVQLTDKWWLWATDIQLADDMDQPQADYFRAIAQKMDQNSKIILCSAEPGWLYTGTNSKSWNIMGYAIGIAESAARGHTIPVLLSGDTHHYSRYSADDGKQFITSGGGGAFLHPTHQLDDRVKVNWQGTFKGLSLAECYPSKQTSSRLLWRNLFFAATNWDFSLLMGIIYWLAAIGLTLRNQWDAYIIVAAIFAGAIMRYTYVQEKSARPAVLITSALHSAAHILAVIYFTNFFLNWNAANFTLTGEWYSVWKWLFILLIEMGAVGFVVGSTIFGLNMLITCGLFRMNHNDAFSAFRLGNYNNFLRIKIKGNNLEIFAIGLKEVPKREDWVANPKSGKPRNPDEPVFVPKVPLNPHIIEKVVV